MKKFREIAGYVLGGLLFVLLIPAVMWFASGRPAVAYVSVLRASVAALMMFGGGLSYICASVARAILWTPLDTKLPNAPNI